jgi:hypothetical protein
MSSNPRHDPERLSQAGAQATELEASREDLHKPGFSEDLGDDGIEQLRRYQVMTIPPNARAELMAAKLPEATPELLQDTVPPNRNASGPDVVAPKDVPAPAVKSRSRLGDAELARHERTVLIPRVRQRKQRTAALIAAGAAALLAIAGIVIARLDTHGEPPPGAPAPPITPVAPKAAPATPLAPKTEAAPPREREAPAAAPREREAPAAVQATVAVPQPPMAPIPLPISPSAKTPQNPRPKKPATASSVAPNAIPRKASPSSVFDTPIIPPAE